MQPSFKCLVRIAIIKNDNDLKHFIKTTVSKEAKVKYAQLIKHVT